MPLDLDSPLLCDLSCSALFSVSQGPIDQPPFESCIGPTCKIRVTLTLQSLDSCEMLQPLLHDRESGCAGHRLQFC